MSNYEARLAEVEEAFEELELVYNQLQAKLARVLRDRPSDFVVRRGDRYWIQFRNTRGEAGSYGFSKLSVDHPSVWRQKRRLIAQRQADYLNRINHCDDIEVEEVPRDNV